MSETTGVEHTHRAAGLIASGRVLQVNVSSGGVPKLPVDGARVGPFGLDGDKHNEPTVHGGPHRAVCLFGIEVIERLNAEGHPIGPGGAGENLTTAGIEWSALPIGSTVSIGDSLVLELSWSATPCATQTGNFSDGNFNRILIDKHPYDSRMYARVLQEGFVAPGDAIAVVGPAPDSRAIDELVIKRLDRVEGKSSVAAWKAARDAGYDIRIVEDGELVMSACPDLPGPAFNQASGLAGLPNMLDIATRFYDRHGTTGYMWLAEPPWPDAVVTLDLGVFAACPADVPEIAPPPGVVIREIGADEADKYSSVRSGEPTAGGIAVADRNPWPQVYERLARSRSRQLFLAEIDGRAVGNASLHISAHTGWLRGATVSVEARGRGIQQALIATRARAAAAAGCDLIGASAEPDETSARNLERLGMRMVGRRTSFEYVPQVAARR